MKRLLILTALVMLTVSASGCGRWRCREGLFGRRFQRDCCQPVCETSSPCAAPCDTCGATIEGTIIAPPATLVPAPAR